LRESGCPCPVCTDHAMKEIAQDEALIAEHNLHTCFAAVREVRRAIAHGDLWELVERRARAHPTLLVALRQLRDHHQLPDELDHVSPMAQSVVPDSLDVESLEAAEVFFREWAAGAGYPFGLLWEGESSLDELRARAPGKRAVDWNAARIRATADHQFGRGAA